MDKYHVMVWLISWISCALIAATVAGCIAYTTEKRLDYCLAVKATPSECRVLEAGR